jgi:hypothetical protein
MWRSTAARSAAWRITTRASGSAGRMSRPGRRPRSCWPLTWATAPMTRATAPDLLRRALACLAAAARAGRVAIRADAGYFAGQLARAAHDAHIAFTIGAKRIAPLWRLPADIAEDARHDAIDMDGAQVAVTEYCPDWWPADTRLLPDPPGPAGPGPDLRRPAVPAPPHPAPGPAGPADSRTGAAAGRLGLQLHHDQPGRIQPGQGDSGRALVPSPRHGGEHLPRQQARHAAFPGILPDSAAPARLPKKRTTRHK